MGKVFTHADVQAAARTSFAYEEAGDARQVRTIRRLAHITLAISVIMITAICFYIGREICHGFV